MSTTEAIPPPRRFLQFDTTDGRTIRLRAYQVALIDADSKGAVIEAVIKDARKTYRTDTPRDELLAAHARALEDDIMIEAF